MSIDKIKELQARMDAKTEFKKGDVVEWKDGLRHKRLPEYGQKCLVVASLDAPDLDHVNESSSPHYREPLDIVLAFLDADGDLVHYHYDSRRFELSK